LFHFGFREGSVFGFPLGDAGETVSDGEGTSSGFCHPGRDAHAFFFGCGEYPPVDVGVDSDRKFRRGVADWHIRSIPPR
jgi:hypothetical protein